MTPGKVGELLKAWLLRARAGTPMAVSAPVILAERLTDGVAMLILASAGLLLYRHGWQALLADRPRGRGRGGGGAVTDALAAHTGGPGRDTGAGRAGASPAGVLRERLRAAGMAPLADGAGHRRGVVVGRVRGLLPGSDRARLHPQCGAVDPRRVCAGDEHAGRLGLAVAGWARGGRGQQRRAAAAGAADHGTRRPWWPRC